MQLYSIR
jgi:hypothetical protein